VSVNIVAREISALSTYIFVVPNYLSDTLLVDNTILSFAIMLHV